MVVLICGDCGHATDVKDDAFAEELLQLEVFHVPCKGTEGKGVMRRGEPFKHIANASVHPLHSESTSEDNNALVDLDMPGLFKELMGWTKGLAGITPRGSNRSRRSAEVLLHTHIIFFLLLLGCNSSTRLWKPDKSSVIREDRHGKTDI